MSTKMLSGAFRQTLSGSAMKFIKRAVIGGVRAIVSTKLIIKPLLIRCSIRAKYFVIARS
jgi:hypothetical protein